MNRIQILCHLLDFAHLTVHLMIARFFPLYYNGYKYKIQQLFYFRRHPMEPKKKTNSMEKLATFIVDKRHLFFVLYIFALLFSVIAIPWTKVENDVTTYLSDETETKQ